MAIAALSNFTVPLASDQSASSQGMLMPKLKYRFRLSFENFGTSGSTTELTKQVQETVRPNVKFTNTVIDVYNSKINYAGKPEWQPITVKLRDDATNAVTTLVGEQIQKQFDFFEQSSAASGLDYKFTMRIEMLDGGNGSTTPTSLEVWEVYGCYIESSNYNDLKYSENGPVMIDLSIRYDNALQTTPSNGVGAVQTVQKFPGGTSVLGS
jgi:hypothetical protein